MRYAIILIIFQMAVVPWLRAQDTLKPAWVITRRSPVSTANAEAWGINAARDGSLYWATNQTGTGILSGYDVYLYRLDADGHELWPRPFVYVGDFAQQSYNVIAGDTAVYVQLEGQGNQHGWAKLHRYRHRRPDPHLARHRILGIVGEQGCRAWDRGTPCYHKALFMRLRDQYIVGAHVVSATLGPGYRITIITLVSIQSPDASR
ncbi:MAG: hypothetical protein JWQ98_3403 [Chlorobi bacterium]|nr:hypothetical protein [Chlorobiota bacterium]